MHPSALLYLGYDGAVDPTTYLRAWPLAKRVHLLPPVQLPGGAPSGFGSVSDFRKLLAVHPLPVKPRPAAAKPRGERPAAPAPRKAFEGVRTAAATAGGPDSTLPIALGILMVAGALAAIAHSARDGRT